MDLKEQLLKVLHTKGVQTDLDFIFNYRGQKLKRTVGDVMEVFLLKLYSDQSYQLMIEDIESLTHEACVQWVWGIGFGQLLQEKVEAKDARVIQGLVALVMSGREVSFSVRRKGMKEVYKVGVKDDHLELRNETKKTVETIIMQRFMELLLNWSGRLEDIPQEALVINAQQNTIH